MKKIMFIIVTVIVISSFTGCGKYSDVTKLLDRYNNSTSRYWKEIILEYGIDAMDSDGDTILSAAIVGRNLELIEAILKNKFDLNRPVKNNLTALRYAWQFYDISKDSEMIPVMKLLIKYNASPIVDEWNCLTYAIRYRYPAVVDAILPYYTKNKLLDFSDKKENYSCISFIGHTYQDDDDPSNDPEMIATIKKLCDVGFFPTKDDFNGILRQYVNLHVDDYNATILKKIIEKLALSGKYKSIDIQDNSENFRGGTINQDISFKERRPDRYISIFPILIDNDLLFYNFPPDNNLYAKMYIASVSFFRKQGSQTGAEYIAYCNRAGRAYWENIWTLETSTQFFNLIDSYYANNVIKDNFMSFVTGFEAKLAEQKSSILSKFDDYVNRDTTKNYDRYWYIPIFYSGGYVRYLYNFIDDAGIHSDLRDFYFEYLDKDIKQKYARYFDIYQ